MNNFMGILIFQILLLIFLFFTMNVKTDGAGPAGPDDGCKPTRCRHNGPVIKFPFRLRDRQPTHCGYQGFEISCTADKKKHTVLELPTAVKLFVKHINYTNQQIQVYDPNNCFPRQILNLNISASPFQFYDRFDFMSSPILFNCSSTYDYSGYVISCLSTHDYRVIAAENWTDTSFSELSSCKKMFDSPSVPYSIINNDQITTSLEWSKPMCEKCEAEGKECVLDRNSSLATQTKCLDIRKHNTAGESRNKLVITGIILGSFIPVVLVGIGIYKLHSSNKMEKENRQKIEKFLQDYRDLKPTRYSYADVKRITNQFKEKLGQGGYGTVFKGRISNDVIVAVKILNNFKGTTTHGDEFINEVGSMGTIHHVNVARLVGFCADGVKRALVYEFLPNGSLEKYIFSADGQRQSHDLGWEKLQDIALGIAKGIDYLHQGCDQRIIHLDIKPHNVLLDQNFIPKISDFGMAKLCSKEQSAVSMTAARGTMGYIAPEVLSRNFGSVSYKSDVYSFGMLLLEIVGGRKNIDVNVNVDNTSQVYFPEWVYKHLNKEEGDLGMGIVEQGQFKIIKKLVIVGLWCIQWYPVNRPSMNKVVRMLEGGENDLVMPPNPFASADSLKGSSTVLRTPMHSALDIISESH